MKTRTAEAVQNHREQYANQGSHNHLENILVAVDLIQSSSQALQLAGRLAERFGSRVYLLYVEDPGSFMNGVENTVVISKTFAEIAAEDVIRLKRLARSELPSNVSSDQIVRSGRPAREILNVAAELHIDLIVLTQRRHSALISWLRGGTAETVVHQARCPVLVLPNAEATNLEPAFERENSMRGS